MSQQKNISHERSIWIKQLLLEIIKKNGAQSQSVLKTYIYNMYLYSTWLDWLWPPYFPNYFESELFHEDRPFTKFVTIILHIELIIFNFNLCFQLAGMHQLFNTDYDEGTCLCHMEWHENKVGRLIDWVEQGHIFVF